MIFAASGGENFELVYCLDYRKTTGVNLPRLALMVVFFFKTPTCHANVQ